MITDLWLMDDWKMLDCWLIGDVFDDLLMTDWWLIDNWLMTDQWLIDDWLMTDDWLMIDWWLIDDWSMIDGMALSQFCLCLVLVFMRVGPGSYNIGKLWIKG